MYSVVFFSKYELSQREVDLPRPWLDAGSLLMYSRPRSYPRTRIALKMRGPGSLLLRVVTAPLDQVARVDYEAEHVRWYQRPLLWCNVDGQNANRNTI